MKKLLVLAGSNFQIPVIKYAKDHGYYVITCDNRPENPGHKLSDKFVNVSTIDLDGVLHVARENKVDGILAYASDPAAPTAGYVSEKLGLPGNSYEAMNILGVKSKYRRFLKENKFNHPKFIVAKNGSYEDGELETLRFPLMVKPADGAGSKGVTKIENVEEISSAIKTALSFSRNKEIVIEEVINKVGHQIGGEAYVYKGEVVMMCLGDQKVNAESTYKYVPIGMTFPAQLEKHEVELIRTELTRLLAASGFGTGALNLEIMRTADRKFYFMEIGPRSGGNLLPELMRYTCGFDVADYSVEHALGNDVIPPKALNTDKGFHAYFAVHSQKKGVFNGLEKDPLLDKWIVEEHIFFDRGQEYDIFKHSGYVIGIWLLRFPDKQSADGFFKNPYSFYRLLQ